MAAPKFLGLRDDDDVDRRTDQVAWHPSSTPVQTEDHQLRRRNSCRTTMITIIGGRTTVRRSCRSAPLKITATTIDQPSHQPGGLHWNTGAGPPKRDTSRLNGPPMASSAAMRAPADHESRSEPAHGRHR